MIIIDYNAIAISNMQAQKMEPTEPILRHVILNSIRMYRKKFGKEYGEVVIAYDAGGNWRRDYYEFYKANRAAGREEDTIDWDEVYRIIGKIRDEIFANFPYKVVGLKGAEADDVIAVIIETTQEFGQNEDVMIISGDKDFKQLQKYSNVYQFSNLTKKFLVEKDPHAFLKLHTYKGDGSDGVPNVFSPDNFFMVDGPRQKSVTAKKIEEWNASDNLKETMGEEIFKNYERNKKMIDLSQVPEEITAEILEIYESQTEQAIKHRKVLNYLIKNQCKQLMSQTGDFING